MALGILTYDEKAIYSENLLNKFLTFNEAFTWNIVSGGANGVSENSNSGYIYAGSKALMTTFTDTGVLVIDSGGTQTDITIAKTGNYIMSFRLAKDDADASIDVGFYVYVNGVSFPYNKFEETLTNTSTPPFIDDQWNCYFQYMTLTAGDVISFQFDFQSNVIGSKCFLDGLKLELVDRALGLPSYYLEPLPIIIEQTSTVDVASVPDNDTVFTIVTITGAVVGDKIEMIPNVTALGLKLTWSCYVSATDTATIVASNSSGGAINPASGSFYFKITR